MEPEVNQIGEHFSQRGDETLLLLGPRECEYHDCGDEQCT
jgi:hypothetical protein